MSRWELEEVKGKRKGGDERVGLLYAAEMRYG